MGRPVFHELGLDELIAASNFVLVVSPSAPPRRIDDAGASYLRFVVVEVLGLNRAAHRQLKSAQDVAAPLRSIVVGETIEVLSNRVNLTDVANRRLSSSGVSFPAERYRGDVAADASELVAFVRQMTAGLELTAQGALESISKRAEIVETVARFEANHSAREQR